VPNLRSNDVYVIDPATYKVIDRFCVGVNPQYVVPSWDFKTLWVTNNAEGRTDGSMYFSPDGRCAIVVAEALKRLDFRDPQTMVLQSSLAVPQCAGINHAEFLQSGDVQRLVPLLTLPMGR
jgi:YVTN family beta-propeller protein